MSAREFRETRVRDFAAGAVWAADEVATPVGREALAELDRLRAWKTEALEVLNAWERVWEAAGKPGRLGSSKADGVRRYIEAVRAEAYRAGASRPVSPATGEVVVIPRPVVPHGPHGLTENEGTAHYLRGVVRKIDSGFLTVGGSNVTATVRKLLLDTADAITERGAES